MIYALEVGLIVVALILGFGKPNLASGWLIQIEKNFAKLANRPRLAVLVAGVTALAARAALLPVLPIPNPAFHDEFCYLLAADTFAHGRLANPTHPMWVHFETHYVLWHPTYASMFPPAQGLFMALGQLMLGHPFGGVWLSLGFMCAALTWMLQGWLPPKWALLGGFLAVIRIATFSYWANSYWGGVVAAGAGALVYGALPRLKKSPKAADALVLALGLGILANSRPFEGLVISLPALASLFFWMAGRNHPPFHNLFGEVLLPAGALLAVVAAFMGYNNWRVTGHPLEMGHQAYNATHAANPYFLWQKAKPLAVDHHDVTQDFYKTIELPYWRRIHTPIGLLRLEVTRFVELWSFYLLPLFTLPFLVVVAITPVGFAWHDLRPPTRFLMIALAFALFGYSWEVYFNPHYFAPATCLIYALLLTALRDVRNWQWREKPVGLAMARSIPAIAVLLAVIFAAFPSTRPEWSPELWTWCSPGASSLMADRARIETQLEREPGPQLVFVHYAPKHQLGLDWVYNRADIDASQVVWARDLGPEKNAELVKYFQGRRIWLAEPDANPPRLSPYPAS
jgi:hypothetical protein